MAIPSPALGLLVYDMDSSLFAYKALVGWRFLSTGSGPFVSGEPTRIIDTDEDTWIDTDLGKGDGDTIVFHLGDISGKGTDAMILRKNQYGQVRLEFPNAYQNTFIGDNAGEHNQQGIRNVGLGYEALHNNDFGFANAAIGVGAMYNNVSGSRNVAMGYTAMQGNKVGSGNVGIGFGALYKANLDKTIAIGDSALYNLTTDAPGLTAVGIKAGYSNAFGYFNTYVGFESGMSNLNASYNSFFGHHSGHDNSSGADNSFFGYFAGEKNISGSENSVFGSTAFHLNVSGNRNVAMGFHALGSNIVGTQSTAVGWNALAANLASNNTALGSSALLSNTSGSDNTATGINSLVLNTTGSENVANGGNAMYTNTGGNANVAVGRNAMYYNTSGGQNVAVGHSALHENTTGGQNVSVGYFALDGNKTGNLNTALGYQANVASIALNNATALGANAVVNASNKVRIGNSSVTVIEGQVAYTFPSDGRFKYNIHENVKGLEFIKRLRPVTYQFDREAYSAFIGEQGLKTKNLANQNKEEEIIMSGFIAQEVDKAAREAGFQFDGVMNPKNDKETWSLAYSQFVVPLVKAIQEQQKEIELLKSELAELRRQQQDEGKIKSENSSLRDK